MNTPRLLLAATAIAAASLLASCGSDDSGSTKAPPPAGDAAAAPASSDPTAAQSAPAAAPASQDVDACTLLTTQEVAQLFPQPTSKPVSSSQPGQSMCRWEGGADPSGPPPDLVLGVSVLPKDLPVDQIKQSFQAEAADNNGQLVQDLGQVGIVESVINGAATVKWIDGPYLVSLDLSASGAETQQDAVVTAARAVSGRLG